MIRKIAADALRPGMYVHDLCCSWVDHPFLLNRFALRSEADIAKILDAGITEVLIDTERGKDLARAAPERAPRSSTRRPPGPSTPPAQPARSRRAREKPPPSPMHMADGDAKAGGSDAPFAPVAPDAAPNPKLPGPDARAGPGTAAAPAPPAPPKAGATPGAATPPPAAQAAAPTVLPAGPAAPEVRVPVSIADEFREAKRVHAEGARVVRDILNDVRLGRQVSIERTQAVVARMAETILRNPGPLLALSRLKQRDEYTFLHCVAVSALLMVFARAAGLGVDEVRAAGIGGLLHDVGKMKVPLGLLNKAGRLTPVEMEAVRQHVPFGVDILQATPGVMPLALQIAAEHHERYDGTGYPKGLKAAAISRIGQMTSIVDVYDAMTSDRVYHRGLTPPEALKQLLAGAGTHFAVEPVQLFIKTLGIYPTGSLVMLESGRLAIVVQTGSNLLQPRVRIVYDTRKAAFVPPFDVDLARTAGHGGEDRILRHESPLKWSVDPVAYLLEDAC